MPRNKSAPHYVRPGDDGKKPVAAESSKKPRRWKWHVRAGREVHRQQKSTKNLLKAAAFKRIVRDVLKGATPGGDMRMTKNACDMLRETSQDLLISIMTSAEVVRAMEPSGLKSIQSRHFQVARSMANVECFKHSQLPVQVPLGARQRKLLMPHADDAVDTADASF